MGHTRRENRAWVAQRAHANADELQRPRTTEAGKLLRATNVSRVNPSDLLRRDKQEPHDDSAVFLWQPAKQIAQRRDGIRASCLSSTY